VTKKVSDTELRELFQPLTDFVLEFDEETQELWMRLFELHWKQKLTEQESEEAEILLSEFEPGPCGDCIVDPDF